jgi:acyl-CoA synthetase (NDP forming)
VSLDPLLRPKSIAILGASERPSLGRSLILSAQRIGFEGKVYPINPKYPEILGHACYPSVEALPEAPDVVAFCVSYQRILESFRPLAAKGVKAAAIFDGGFAERGEEGARLQSEIVGICREAGILLNGPNCMGVLNPAATCVVILRGEGRSFCVGYDITGGDPAKEAWKHDALKWHENLRESLALEMMPWDMKKPVIASVQGHALGERL